MVDKLAANEQKPRKRGRPKKRTALDIAEAKKWRANAIEILSLWGWLTEKMLSVAFRIAVNGQRDFTTCDFETVGPKLGADIGLVSAIREIQDSYFRMETIKGSEFDKALVDFHANLTEEFREEKAKGGPSKEDRKHRARLYWAFLYRIRLHPSKQEIRLLEQYDALGSPADDAEHLVAQLKYGLSERSLDARRSKLKKARKVPVPFDDYPKGIPDPYAIACFFRYVLTARFDDIDKLAVEWLRLHPDAQGFDHEAMKRALRATFPDG